MRNTAKLIFWTSTGLIAWTHAGYGLFLAALRWLGRDRYASQSPTVPAQAGQDPVLALCEETAKPKVSLIIAAYREQNVIATKVANALALQWPRERLEIIVAVDGASENDADQTAAQARAAGADLVLELERVGKVRAQDAAVARACGELLAFSDANAMWSEDALLKLVEPFSDPRVGYVCGQVQFLNDAGDNQEGLYWRYDMWLRAQESELASITAGNGAIYAVRSDAYFAVDAVMGHDLSFPFNLVKRGWRAVYAADAHAVEKMVPTITGEWERKRRMMAHTWPIVLRAGMLSVRGYSPLYAVMIFSHRVLRYLTPFLHGTAFGTSARLAPGGPRWARVAFITQICVGLGGALGGRIKIRPFIVARYYIFTTAAIAAGGYDWLRKRTTPGWDSPADTR